MPPVPRSRVRRLLRRADEGAFEAFVAALWRARGWAVSRAGGRLVATHPDTGAVRRLAVHTIPRWRPKRGPPTPDDADLVVVNRRVPDVPQTVLDADDVAGMVRHAVSPATGTALLRRHLDADRPAGGRWRAVTPRAAVVGAVVLVVLAAAVGVAVLPSGPRADRVRPPVTATAGGGGASSTASPTPAGPTPAPGADLPPGVTAGGLADPVALVGAHARLSANRSYALTLTAERVEAGRSLGAYRERLLVRSDWTYATAIETSGAPPQTHPVIAGREVYSSGNGVFVRGAANHSRDPAAMPTPSAASLATLEGRVAGYLRSTLRLDSSTVHRSSAAEGDPTYRIEGTNQRPDGTIETVSAAVSTAGAIRAIRVERPAPGGGGTVVVTLRYVYGPVSVFPPTWAPTASVGRG